MSEDRRSYTKAAPIGKGPGPLPPGAKLVGPHSRQAQKAHASAQRQRVSMGRATRLNAGLNSRRKAGRLEGAGRTPKASKPAQSRIYGQGGIY